jgi:hypothetical protein
MRKLMPVDMTPLEDCLNRVREELDSPELVKVALIAWYPDGDECMYLTNDTMEGALAAIERIRAQGRAMNVTLDGETIQ